MLTLINLQGNGSHDEAYWIDPERFRQFETDIHMRTVQDVRDVYSMHWFEDREHDGMRIWRPPAIFLPAETLQFISGRHRTAVLLRHNVDRMPMFLTCPSHADRAAFKHISLGPVRTGEVFDMPDLPVVTDLPEMPT